MTKHIPSEETARDCFLDGAAGEDLPEDWDAFIARVRRDAKAEALRNLPPHLSLQAHQCEAREGGGNYCRLEEGHSGDHRILGVPDGWIRGAVDRYIEQIQAGDRA